MSDSAASSCIYHLNFTCCSCSRRKSNFTFTRHSTIYDEIEKQKVKNVCHYICAFLKFLHQNKID